MAIEKFYSNVRTGLYSLGPRATEIIGNAYPDRIRPRVGTWPSPETVADYDDSDFADILPPAEVNRLTEAVQTFEAIADEAFRNRGISEADQERAIEALKTIVAILETEKYSYGDRFRIRKLLDQCLEEIQRHVDPRVEALPFRIEPSSSEEGCDLELIVWAVVSSELYQDEPLFRDVASRIRDIIPRHLAKHHVPYQVLVMMRTSDEQSRLVSQGY